MKNYINASEHVTLRLRHASGLMRLSVIHRDSPLQISIEQYLTNSDDLLFSVAYYLNLPLLSISIHLRNKNTFNKYFRDINRKYDVVMMQ